MSVLPHDVTERLDQVSTLCEQQGVRKLAIFGSAAKGTFDEATSDVDFVVEFFPHPDPLIRGDRYWALLFALQDLFGRDVDLVVASSITNPYFSQVLQMTQRPIYEAA